MQSKTEQRDYKIFKELFGSTTVSVPSNTERGELLLSNTEPLLSSTVLILCAG